MLSLVVFRSTFDIFSADQAREVLRRALVYGPGSRELGESMPKRRGAFDWRAIAINSFSATLVTAAPAECSTGDRLIREVQFAHSLLNKTAIPKVSPSDHRRLVTE